MRRALMLTVVVLLGACQTSYRGNEDSPYYLHSPVWFKALSNWI